MNVSNIEAETKEPVQVTARPILESKSVQSHLGKLCGPDENA